MLRTSSANGQTPEVSWTGKAVLEFASPMIEGHAAVTISVCDHWNYLFTPLSNPTRASNSNNNNSNLDTTDDT